MIKKLLPIFTCLLLSGCNDNKTGLAENVSENKNYAFSYSSNFSKVFNIYNESAVELPSGVDAIKAYTSNGIYGTSFYLQLYVDKSLDLHFSNKEETLIINENHNNGFLDFSEANGLINSELKTKFLAEEKRQSDLFGARVISYSENLAATASFLRYTTNIIPEYTLIEVAIPGPDVEAVYLYTGENVAVGIKPILTVTGKLRETDDLSQDGYLKIPLPQKIKNFYMDNCGTLCPPE